MALSCPAGSKKQTEKLQGLMSAARPPKPCPPPIELPDFAEFGLAFGLKNRPGEDPRIRLATPPIRPMTDCYGMPVVVQAKPLASNANVDDMYYAEATYD
jgi:hypothetical protein